MKAQADDVEDVDEPTSEQEDEFVPGTPEQEQSENIFLERHRQDERQRKQVEDEVEDISSHRLR